MRAVTHDPCLTSAIEIPPIELRRLPWASLLLLASGAIVAALVASEAHGSSRGTSNRAAPPPTAVALPVVDEVPVEPAEPEREWVDVPLYDLNRRELTVFTLPLDGELDEAQAKEIARFMRCRRTGRKRRMHPGVMAMLADLARHYPGHVIEIVSAHRRRRGDRRSSRHRHGSAIDLHVRGVRLRDVRDYLWTKYTENVGVGYYPHSRFVHLDYRPSHKALAWTQKRKNSANRYRPWWSIKLRRRAAKMAAVERAAAAAQTASDASTAAATTSRLPGVPSAVASPHPANAARAAMLPGRSASKPRL